MAMLRLRTNALGYEVHAGERLVTIYRAREELARQESPKPCFAPIYTPAGHLVTEYRPADHLWHTGLYFGWVHANRANLWGGPWYVPDSGKYEQVPHSHGVQRHDRFPRLHADGGEVVAEEALTWLDADDQPIAEEARVVHIAGLDEPEAWLFTIDTCIAPRGGPLCLGASRAARYSGLELRLGPPFCDAAHWCSEGRRGHEAIMGQRARWVAADGAAGGSVVMLDHPGNPRHPVTWFVRRNLLGAGLLMPGDMELAAGDRLRLRYGLAVLGGPAPLAQVEGLYRRFASA